jgi:fatty aldehyde-generating acyl-ACP reductase
MLPYFTHTRPPSFSFIVHPRGIDDLYRFASASFFLKYSRDEDEFRRKICSVSPLIIGETTFGMSPFRGELVCVARMPEEMIGDGAKDAVAEAFALASSRGSHVVGLGALTSPVTGAGATLLRQAPRNVTVTNGNAYTAAVIAHNVNEARDIIGRDGAVRIGIVGCTGSVGAPTTRLLAAQGHELILVGRSVDRLKTLFPDLGTQATLSASLGALANADIIVLLTNDPSALLTDALPLKSCLVIDCAQPSNVSASAKAALSLRDVRVLAGGIVHIPGYISTYDFGLPVPESAFACLAETYLFAKEGIREHSTGRPDVALSSRLERAALRHGIRPVSLRELDSDARVRREGSEEANSCCLDCFR